MNKYLKQLVEISRFYGSKKDYVIAGGGNTSCKDEKKIWVKASGTSLANIPIDDFVVLHRKKLKSLSEQTFSDDPQQREVQVKEALSECLVDPNSGKRPSVETSLHELIRYRFVVHMHPTLVNGLMCSRNARTITHKLFGEKALFVPYTDPGYTLFHCLKKKVLSFRKTFGEDPKIIFLENHGVFVSSDSVGEIKKIYREIMSALQTAIDKPLEIKSQPIPGLVIETVPAVRMMLAGDAFPVVRLCTNSLLLPYTRNKTSFDKISKPFIPDAVVYCRKEWIYIENTSNPDKLLEELGHKLKEYEDRNGYKPKIVVLKNVGVLGIDSDSRSVDTVLKVFEDLVKIRYYSEFFGRGKVLTNSQIDFIDQWEVENYRRKISKGSMSGHSARNMIALVTGGAQGFGKGITEALFHSGADVVIADINGKQGKKLENHLNVQALRNRALFLKADVTRPKEVRNLMVQTVANFGGLDLLISNAGVLKAGSLDEMDPESFDLVTKVNYTGYFNCAKAASEIFIIQQKQRPDKYSDIIQINSKSGLKGSNKNFAYAGSKFGGIGLTQSFALELIPFKIKVNSICPGNFFDGPLWSDPENGLFVQYLRAGKVPGAKSIADVKKQYESLVPMGRGCEVDDVMKAIWYAMDQKYETGQAIPVTGGQVMLS